ncbi:MAG: DNA-binding response regulator, partial [Candidatus Berkelbacteria bacterium]|nr:DNA-binding response regulator [Candidatus Berkelbacteria bacterium]
ELKRDETTKNIPVIMLTALIQNENKTRSIAGGADDYIVKSETMPGEVIEKINRVIAKKKPPEEK